MGDADNFNVRPSAAIQNDIGLDNQSASAGTNIWPRRSKFWKRLQTEDAAGDGIHEPIGRTLAIRRDVGPNVGEVRLRGASNAKLRQQL